MRRWDCIVDRTWTSRSTKKKEAHHFLRIWFSLKIYTAKECSKFQRPSVIANLEISLLSLPLYIKHSEWEHVTVPEQFSRKNSVVTRQKKKEIRYFQNWEIRLPDFLETPKNQGRQVKSRWDVTQALKLKPQPDTKLWQKNEILLINAEVS